MKVDAWKITSSSYFENHSSELQDHYWISESVIALFLSFVFRLALCIGPYQTSIIDLILNPLMPGGNKRS